MKILNIKIGQKFGRLTVLEKKGVSKNNHRMYLCKCDCGTIKEFSGHRLLSHHTKSCGCLCRELARERRILPEGEASFNQLYAVYKQSAKERNYSFGIEKEDFKKITSSECFYCGSKPIKEYKHKQVNGFYKYNGIDRIDNSNGYIKNNIVPCCFKCNVAKGEMTLDEFKNHLLLILNNWVMRIK